MGAIERARVVGKHAKELQDGAVGLLELGHDAIVGPLGNGFVARRQHVRSWANRETGIGRAQGQARMENGLHEGRALASRVMEEDAHSKVAQGASDTEQEQKRRKDLDHEDGCRETIGQREESSEAPRECDCTPYLSDVTQRFPSFVCLAVMIPSKKSAPSSRLSADQTTMRRKDLQAFKPVWAEDPGSHWTNRLARDRHKILRYEPGRGAKESRSSAS